MTLKTGILQGISGTEAEFIAEGTINGFVLGWATDTKRLRFINDSTWSASSPINPENGIVLLSDVPGDGVVRANVVPWVFPVLAGKQYRFGIVASYQSEGVAVGGSMGIVMPTGAAVVQGFLIAQGATAIESASINAVSSDPDLSESSFTTTGVPIVDQSHFWFGIIKLTCLTSGTLQFQWGAMTAAGGTTLMAGSSVAQNLLN